MGIRITRGMYRTLKLFLESHIGKYLPAKHPISAWLLQREYLLINVRCRGADLLIPWQRVKGRCFRPLLLSFCECIFYKWRVKDRRRPLMATWAAAGWKVSSWVQAHV